MEKNELVKDIIVMCVAAPSFPRGIVSAFEKRESKIPSITTEPFDDVLCLVKLDP